MRDRGEPCEGSEAARAILARARGEGSRGARGDLAIELAGVLGSWVLALETPAERRRRRRAARRLSSEKGVALSVALADRYGRAHDGTRNVRAASDLVRALAPLDVLPAHERAGLEALARAPGGLAGLAQPALSRAMDREMSPYLSILDGPDLRARLGGARLGGAEPILHLLGEEVVGERQASSRAAVEASLYDRFGVRHLAVKPSSIGSRFTPMGVDEALARVLPRARLIAEAASPGRSLVFDAESSDELEVTRRLVADLARDPRFAEVEIGMALQAYLVDSGAVADELVELSRERARRRFAPLRVRLVKGANLGIERIRASLRGFPSAVRREKDETDREARRLLERLASPEHGGALRLALGSHNLFDVAYALVQRAALGLGDALSFELLAGMADPLARAIHRLGSTCRVYLPVVARDERMAAVAYLARRLDEQSAPAHFLPASLVADDARDPYAEHRARFERTLRAAESARRGSAASSTSPRLDRPFESEPDTDLRRPEARDLLARALEREATRPSFDVVGSHRAARLEPGFDPSRPGHAPYRVGWADADGVRSVLDRARALFRSMTPAPVERRAERLLAMADALRAARAELTAAIVLDAGKSAPEADAEVSEAIDFAEYYARSLLALDRDPTLRSEPRGVVLIASPWNFPLSIPFGGVCAALAMGNVVVLKPAPETPYVGRRLAEVAWSAGLDPGVELLLARDEEATLAIDPRAVDAVILTGATETARAFRRRSPALHLVAETGGKNAIYVSAMADAEAAIRDVVHSAFGYAGQKCSAASLLLLEREVFEDRGFRERLLDAASSLPVGSAWDPDVEVTPLIRPPRGPLLEALEGRSPGGRCLLRAERGGDARLFGPAIYGDVARGSPMHRVELFGPALAVMPAEDLDDALGLIAETGYALTAGIQSLDEREQERFATQVRAGNVYVNRVITGARVGRQPFGGFGLSAFGPGEKTGGPGFVATMGRLADEPAVSAAPMGRGASIAAAELLEALESRASLAPEDARALWEIAADDAEEARGRLGLAPIARLRGELNLFGYEPVEGFAVVAGAGVARRAILRCLLARLAVDERATLYAASGFRAYASPRVEVRSLRALERDIGAGLLQRLRVAGELEDALVRSAVERDVDLVFEPIARSSRAELRHALSSRAVCVTRHRHGVPSRLPFLGFGAPSSVRPLALSRRGRRDRARSRPARFRRG